LSVHRIRHVCAFTKTALAGNPAAVVDGGGLDGETMQRIALNQHLSETVFLLSPTSDEDSAKLRIFTPASEIPFAGHPIVAASHILVSERIAPVSDDGPLLLETAAGTVPVPVSGEGPRLYTMTQAAPRFLPSTASLGEIAATLGLDDGDVLRAEWISTGIFWLIAQLASLDVMERVRADMMALSRLPKDQSIKAAPGDLSIFCIGAQCPDADIHVRAFAPSSGIDEDPVTGSSNGCTAAFIAKHRLLQQTNGEVSYVAEQGLEMGQPGRVYVRVRGAADDLSVDVGGYAVTTLSGELRLPD